jgi:hypothetical protein
MEPDALILTFQNNLYGVSLAADFNGYNGGPGRRLYRIRPGVRRDAGIPHYASRALANGMRVFLAYT